MVQLRTTNGLILRPIQRLYSFEIAETEPCDSAEPSEPADSPEPSNICGQEVDGFESAVADSRGEYVENVSDDLGQNVRRTSSGRVIKLPGRFRDRREAK